jgi:hypothetical protein
MDTMYTACDTKPNITTDSTAFFEIKATDNDLFNSEVETATSQSAPTATSMYLTNPCLSRCCWWQTKITRMFLDLGTDMVFLQQTTTPPCHQRRTQQLLAPPKRKPTAPRPQQLVPVRLPLPHQAAPTQASRQARSPALRSAPLR